MVGAPAAAAKNGSPHLSDCAGHLHHHSKCTRQDEEFLSSAKECLGDSPTFRRLFVSACGMAAVILVIFVGVNGSGITSGQGSLAVASVDSSSSELKSLRLAQLKRELRFMKAGAVDIAKEIKRDKANEELKTKQEVQAHRAAMEASMKQSKADSQQGGVLSVHFPVVKAKHSESPEQMAEMQVQSVLDILTHPHPHPPDEKKASSKPEPAHAMDKTAARMSKHLTAISNPKDEDEDKANRRKPQNGMARPPAREGHEAAQRSKATANANPARPLAAHREAEAARSRHVTQR